MKRLDQVLDIGPKYAAQFEQNGIRTVIDLATADNLPELSRRTEVPLDLIEDWHERASQKLKASRYRRRIASGIASVALLALGWEVRAFLQSSPRISSQGRALSSQGDALSSQGDALYEKGDYEQAVERYDKVIELDPKSQYAYAKKGSALRILGRYPEALVALDKAVQLNAQSAWAYTERGNTYSDRGDHDRAIVDYDKAIALDPKYKFAYSKAFDLRRLGRNKEAVDALNQAIAIDPQ